MALYGGFVGTETDRSERNWVTNVTILSGDIGVVGDNSDNSYAVVTGTSGGWLHHRRLQPVWIYIYPNARGTGSQQMRRSHPGEYHL